MLACCHNWDGVGKIGDLVTQPLEDIVRFKERLRGQGAIFPMFAACNDLYRFSGQAGIAGKSVSDWVYALHADQSELANLAEVEALEQRTQRAEALVAAYEQGRFIRLMRALKQATHRTPAHIPPR